MKVTVTNKDHKGLWLKTEIDIDLRIIKMVTKTTYHYKYVHIVYCLSMTNINRKLQTYRYSKISDTLHILLMNDVPILRTYMYIEYLCIFELCS